MTVELVDVGSRVCFLCLQNGLTLSWHKTRTVFQTMKVHHQIISSHVVCHSSRPHQKKHKRISSPASPMLTWCRQREVFSWESVIVLSEQTQQGVLKRKRINIKDGVNQWLFGCATHFSSTEYRGGNFNTYLISPRNSFGQPMYKTAFRPSQAWPVPILESWKARFVRREIRTNKLE